VRILVGAFALAAPACSLLAPSNDALSGSYLDPADAAETSTGDAPACAPGTKACSGACVSVASPATGCAGASCESCQGAHASAICVGGQCALGQCENGWANCNGRADDGCEVDTRNSAQFCGSCLVSCEGGSPRCDEGVCVPKCSAVKFLSVAAHASFSSTGMSFGSGDFTVELWLAQHKSFAWRQGSLFASNEATQSNAIVMLFSAGQVFCRVSDALPGGSDNIIASVGSEGAWHHVACVRKAGTLKLFVDGVQRAQAPSTSAVIAAGSAALGRPAGYPTFEAPAALIGPMRISRSARYDGAFRPRTFWTVDADTVLHFMTSLGFNGTKLSDEVGGDNDATNITGVSLSEDTPCR